MKNKVIHGMNRATERLSSRAVYLLAGLSVVVFLLFWTVGFDRPFDENPNFNAPVLTDVVIGLCYLLVAAVLALSLWSVWRSLRLRGKGEAYDNNIPVKKISYGVVVGVSILLLLSFLTGSAADMNINGVVYSDGFWLKVSDMFIRTSLVLLLVAVAAVVYGATKYIRRK